MVTAMTKSVVGSQAQVTMTTIVGLFERTGYMTDQLSISLAAFMKAAITRSVEAEGA